jgi:hypothetical protein
MGSKTFMIVSPGVALLGASVAASGLMGRRLTTACIGQHRLLLTRLSACETVVCRAPKEWWRSPLPFVASVGAPQAAYMHRGCCDTLLEGADTGRTHE